MELRQFNVGVDAIVRIEVPEGTSEEDMATTAQRMMGQFFLSGRRDHASAIIFEDMTFDEVTGITIVVNSSVT